MHEEIRMRRMRLLSMMPLILLGFAAFMGFGTYVVMRLWNWLLPPLFGWSALTFWKAFGMLVLCRLLFGGFGIGGARPGRRREWGRWESMSAEERDRMRESWRGRWSGPEGGGGASI